MTRKDYIEAARILRETDLAWVSRNELVDRFVTWFADDNPRFSPTKFREAAGYVVPPRFDHNLPTDHPSNVAALASGHSESRRVS